MNTKPVTVWVKAGFVLLGAGVIAATFLGDWRLLVAGVIALLVCAVLGAPSKLDAR